MNQGFEEFFGFISGNIDAQSHYNRMGIFDCWEGRELIYESGHHTDLIPNGAIDFIERKKHQNFFYKANTTILFTEKKSR